MKKTNLILKIIKVSFVVVLLLFLSPNFVLAAGGTPTIFSYQGRLTNASGDLLGGSGTSYNFKFSIWNNPTVGSGSKLWPTADPSVNPLTVRQGVFNVNIGDTANGYLDALDYNFAANKDIYLQVEVFNGTAYETLTPRQRISSTIFAQVAGSVNGLGPSSFGIITPFGSSVVSIEATSTQSTGLSIRGVVSQIANLFQIQDSTGSNLMVVDSAGNVGVGVETPSRKLNILDVNSVPQMRLSQSGAVYSEFYVNSAGDTLLSSTGGNFRLQDENLWVCSGGSCDPTVTPVGKGNIVIENAVIFNNKFKLKQIDASTTIMYDSIGSEILEFDEGQ